MKRVTVNAYASFIIQDIDALEWQPSAVTSSIGFKDGDTKTFTVTDRQFDSRIRPQLVELALQRQAVPTTDTGLPRGRQRPIMTYSVEEYMAVAALVDRLTGSPISLATPLVVNLTGRNLIRGTYASSVLNAGQTNSLTLTAVRKGPQGSRVRVRIMPGGTASVTTTISQDGYVDIVIVPTVAQQANLIAAQITGLAALFVGIVAGGSGKVQIPPAGLLLTMSGGINQGVAFALFPSVSAASWLLIEGRTPGNAKNLVTVTILAASGGGSVNVTGNAITVTPAAGTITVSAVAAQINGNAAAAALVKATATGTSNLSPATQAATYLMNGTGDNPVATIGGATATITNYTDSQIDITTTNAALLAVTPATTATDLVSVTVKTGPEVFGAQAHMTT